MFELNCPPIVEANTEFGCPMSIYEGINMRLDAQFNSGSAVSTPLDGKRERGREGERETPLFIDIVLIVVEFYNYNLSFIIDTRSLTVGELFQTTPGGVGIQTTNKTVLIPSYRFEADGKLVGWRICSESSGYVTLQVVTQLYKDEILFRLITIRRLGRFTSSSLGKLDTR